jgi:hypothetical protein
MTDEDATEMAKAIRLGINEAKLALVEWADRYKDEDEKIGFVIIATCRMLAETIEAVARVGDDTMEAKLLRQVDTVLMPRINKLRSRVLDKQ